MTKKHKEKLHLYQNVIVFQLLDNEQMIRRLKSAKTFELVEYIAD